MPAASRSDGPVARFRFYNLPVQPPASLKALSDPIYEAFYGLTEQPFAITTDPRFFYLSASHQRAFTELLNGLRRREGMLMLTGETGIGKTTLCRAVLAALGDRTFSAIILNPYMTGAEVLRIVLRDFGLVSHEELRRGGLATADIAQLLDTLEGFLQSLVPLGSHAVIVLDEAQALTPTVLDQVRMLTGLEYQGKRLVQVVLCGQPGLLQTIKADSLLALNERITRRVELAALPVEDVRGYIEHRLGVAGGTDAVRFDTAAIQAVADLARGLPRRINVLCDRALQEGRIEGVTQITSDLVKRAARAVAGVHEPLPVLPVETIRPVAPAAFAPAPVVAPPASSAAVPAAPAASSTPTEPTTPAASTVPAAPAAPAASSVPAAPAPPTGATTTPAAATTKPAANMPPADPPSASASTARGTATAENAAQRDIAAPVESPAAAGTPPATASEPVGTNAPVVALTKTSATGLSSPTSETVIVARTPAEPAPQPESSPEAAPASSGIATSAPARPQAPAAPRPSLPVVSSPSPVAARADDVDTNDDVSEFLPESAATDDAASVATARELSFGQEKPREGHGGRLLLAAAVVAVVAGIGYAAWGWDVRAVGAAIPPPPPGPALDRGAPPAVIPPTTREELQALHPIRRFVPMPPPDPVVETPPEAAFPLQDGAFPPADGSQ